MISSKSLAGQACCGRPGCPYIFGRVKAANIDPKHRNASRRELHVSRRWWWDAAAKPARWRHAAKLHHGDRWRAAPGPSGFETPEPPQAQRARLTWVLPVVAECPTCHTVQEVLAE